MSNMFCNTIFNQPLGIWNVSNVSDMSNMFYNSSFNQTLEDWNVGKLEKCNYMFDHSDGNNLNCNNSNVTQSVAKWIENENDLQKNNNQVKIYFKKCLALRQNMTKKRNRDSLIDSDTNLINSNMENHIESFNSEISTCKIIRMTCCFKINDNMKFKMIETMLDATNKRNKINNWNVFYSFSYIKPSEFIYSPVDFS
jgi:hypothetical protein